MSALPPTLADSARLLRAREVSPLELLERCLEQADRWEPHIHALLGRWDDVARADAQRAQAELADGRDRGPLHGVPLLVKDLIDVAGVPTTAGSALLRDNVARTDAPVIARLRAGGAVLVGKTNTHEFAYGALTAPTRNPWDVARMPGGSSGGSGAALAAGVAPVALGSDTAGSIREPAALCGVVGLKPTFGRVSCRGVVPLAWSLDTVGPMARSVQDCALLLAAMAGPDPGYRATASRVTPPGVAPSLDGLRVAVAAELLAPLQPGVAGVLDATLDALSDTGAQVEQVAIGDVDELIAIAFVILGSEALSYHRPWLEQGRERYGEDVLAYLELAEGYTAVDYVDAQRLRVAFADRVDRILEGADVLVTPAQMVVAPRVDAELAEFGGGVTRPRDVTLIRPLAPFSVSGHPAVSVPVGWDDEHGLPVGLQLVGSAFRDEELLDVAAAVQRAAGWRERAPRPPA